MALTQRRFIHPGYKDRSVLVLAGCALPVPAGFWGKRGWFVPGQAAELGLGWVHPNGVLGDTAVSLLQILFSAGC